MTEVTEKYMWSFTETLLRKNIQYSMQEKLEIQEIRDNFFLYVQFEILLENPDQDPICRRIELVSAIQCTSHKEVAFYYPIH